MGLLIDGKWSDQWYDTESTGGRFERWQSTFRDHVTAEGEGGFPAEAGRYHLYVANICPWAHRTVIWRRLKGLDDMISLSITESPSSAEGWRFGTGPGCIPDTVNGSQHLHQVYTLAQPNFSGRVTVPVLWDKQRRTIVNNESSEIIRMFNSAFDGLGAKDLDLYPEDLRGDIDALNERIYATVNNGVYRCGFATTQQAYEEAFAELFDTLIELEARLGENRYLLGDRLTESDWRLFPTLVRFDIAYYGNFKCNLRRLVEFPNLWAYARELYQWPGIAETVDFDHIKRGYYGIKHVNPTGIVPQGPVIDWSRPHGRGA
ncbi:MAG: glutathione S-transferase family protein [Alphaproteobacteria bacterium]|jgi:putative glutathione S-transferase|nr:glutathione-dependent reductase [Rhodospirillaceae bacterium]MDP6405362.1 glutathione S-transferase family protein [Alphaproteobacteria bacterium]MDP6623360.1 glutathione S-transferase family protein [Alphaproteobacteria bacterium]|tara:strand:+ start:560 stop:1513 length:954 start_codon:yes stop_codon:yes gene_type:complete